MGLAPGSGDPPESVPPDPEPPSPGGGVVGSTVFCSVVDVVGRSLRSVVVVVEPFPPSLPSPPFRVVVVEPLPSLSVVGAQSSLLGSPFLVVAVVPALSASASPLTAAFVDTSPLSTVVGVEP